MKKIKPSWRDPKPAVADSTPARRRAVKTGLAAGVTSLLLPGEWSRPIVQAILLPAHAQTSPPTEPEPCELILEGCTAQCQDTATSETRYTLAREDGCPVITNIETTSVPPGTNQILILCQFEHDVLVSGLIALPGGIQHQTFGVWRCGPDTAAFTGDPHPTMEIEGVPHTVQFTITVDPGLVTVSQVVVTPV